MKRTLHPQAVPGEPQAIRWVTDVETEVDEPLSGLRAEASCGPIGQVDVPTPGRYRISASYAGERQEHWVDLAPQGGARLSLRWQE